MLHRADYTYKKHPSTLAAMKKPEELSLKLAKISGDRAQHSATLPEDVYQVYTASPNNELKKLATQERSTEETEKPMYPQNSGTIQDLTKWNDAYDLVNISHDKVITLINYVFRTAYLVQLPDL